jgi:hypothetical protein
MDSGLFIGVFSSWEVILTALLLMFLLPLVFYVASTKSRPKRQPSPRIPKLKPALKAAPKPAETAEEDRMPGDRPRRAEPPEPRGDDE